MDESTIPIGIPCMTETQVGSRSFFFVRVYVQTDAVPEQRTLQQVSRAKHVLIIALKFCKVMRMFLLLPDA